MRDMDVLLGGAEVDDGFDNDDRGEDNAEQYFADGRDCAGDDHKGRIIDDDRI